MSQAHNSFDLLMQEMQSDQNSVKINSIYRLPVVIAIESKKPEFKDSLYKWLHEVSANSSDEVLYAIAFQLGLKETYKVLSDKCLDLLEGLAQQDETVVREAAVQSIVKLAKDKDADIKIETLHPFLLRLATAHTFQAKVSFINIVNQIMPNYESSTIIDDLQSHLTKLAEDDTPMIRRALANIIGDMIQTNWNKKSANYVDVWKNFCGDDQEAVKILCMNSMAKVMEKCLEKKDTNSDMYVSEMKNVITEKIIAFQTDKAWKVKKNLAQKMPELAGLGFVLLNNNTILGSLNAL